ncbi:unnamed protein product [Parnassius apollo]|uniref:(apollo) hypothetical protein n=1 Tax=Parnassius apollo TaxID=110799 RepID=A0A8S3Y375_PARAO|nr:unnamed protein product [Parnassius apollo]
METDIFFKYMEKVVIPGVGEERPVLIIYDGHSTHVDVKVVELAIKNNITILKLPPHTSHLLQPLDLAVFKGFKSQWDANLVEWQSENVGSKLQKNAFSELFAEIWSKVKPETIKTYNRLQQKIQVHNENETQNANRTLTSKNPDLLKTYCIAALNRQLLLSETLVLKRLNPVVSKQTGKEQREYCASSSTAVHDVRYLSDISKCDIKCDNCYHLWLDMLTTYPVA